MQRKRTIQIQAKSLKGIVSELHSLSKDSILHRLVFPDGKTSRFVLESKQVMIFEGRNKTQTTPMTVKPVAVVIQKRPTDTEVKVEKETERVKLLNKYQCLASKAQFSNRFIEKCINHESNGTVYSNKLCSNVFIVGKVITVSRLVRHMDELAVTKLKTCLVEHINFVHSFDLFGTNACIELSRHNDCFTGVLTLRKRKLKDEQYQLINEECFIGYK
ncbi:MULTISPECIES: hypothetical protein [Vibrio]|uniref:hypothetical protein n=1 Tax=Vibrio TaxID=662 RepID=UPI00118036C5|nr:MULTISPECIES: hypothetical protein [Vibrio]